MKKNYDEVGVQNSLRRKGIKVDTINKTVEVPYGCDTCGNGSWGKIDFLCNHRKYILLRTGTIAKDGNMITIINNTDRKLKQFEGDDKRKKLVKHPKTI